MARCSLAAGAGGFHTVMVTMLDDEVDEVEDVVAASVELAESVGLPPPPWCPWW
jgi:hypothetical protein